METVIRQKKEPKNPEKLFVSENYLEKMECDSAIQRLNLYVRILEIFYMLFEKLLRNPSMEVSEALVELYKTRQKYFVDREIDKGIPVDPDSSLFDKLKQRGKQEVARISIHPSVNQFLNGAPTRKKFLQDLNLSEEFLQSEKNKSLIEDAKYIVNQLEQSFVGDIEVISVIQG